MIMLFLKKLTLHCMWDTPLSHQGQDSFQLQPVISILVTPIKMKPTVHCTVCGGTDFLLCQNSFKTKYAFILTVPKNDKGQTKTDTASGCVFNMGNASPFLHFAGAVGDASFGTKRTTKTQCVIVHTHVAIKNVQRLTESHPIAYILLLGWTIFQLHNSRCSVSIVLWCFSNFLVLNEEGVPVDIVENTGRKRSLHW